MLLLSLGPQYRSALWFNSPEQRAELELALADEAARRNVPMLATELSPLDTFWPAEGYHQSYLQKGGQNAAKNAPEKVRCYG